MDITPLIAQVQGTLPLLKPLMQRIGLLKSNSTDRTIRYTAPFTLANREADFRIAWAFPRARHLPLDFLPCLILELAND